MDQNPIDQIGEKVREVRKNKKITLKQLAEKTDLSIGYLSNIERKACSPTLDNIQKICSSLGISLMDLLDDATLEKQIIRKEKRKIVFERENLIRYESIHYGEGKMDGLCIYLEPYANYDESNWTHTYDEIGLILEGEMDIRIENTYHHLKKGDSFYIKAGTNHSLSNPGKEVNLSYWVKSPQINAKT